MKKVISLVIIFSLYIGNTISANNNGTKIEVEGKASDCAQMASAAISYIADQFGHNPNVDNFEGYIAVYNILYEGCYNS
jgi:hypothetical protein